MEPRVLVLAIPSALVLSALVWHSVVAMSRRRALLFWLSVLVYGVLRGVGVRAVTEAIGASFPYEIRGAMLSIGGVSAQEVAGWAIVAYLGWWIGDAFSRRSGRPSAFLAVAWAAFFLGAISWAVEAAAIGARWWHWTVPTASRVFLNVPAIGIVDWFFVAIDFLLPFVALTTPALARSRWKFATLLAFPVHFAAHLLPGIWLHVVHWGLVLIVLALALRGETEDRPFADRHRWVPTAAFTAMLLDLALVDLLIVRRPELLQSLASVVAVWLVALHPPAAVAAAIASAILAVKLPSLFVAAAVVLGGAVLMRLRSRRALVAPLIAVALFAVAFHFMGAQARVDLTTRLDAAIAARDSGDVAGALMQFDAIADDHPTSYVPLALGGEIAYRTNDLETAYVTLARAVSIKQDFVRGYRLLAAIDLQRGRQAEGVAWARRGLEVEPEDIQLRFLAGEDVAPEIDTPATAAGMVALAYEVGELAKAQAIAQSARARWPDDARLRRLAARLNLR